MPLLAHLKPNSTFIEPCAGDGRLINHLEKYGHKCVYACDIEPRRRDIKERDVLFFSQSWVSADYFITNPPWTRDILHMMMGMFTRNHPTWLLFDADWIHTKQAAPYLRYCRKIVSVGRISWEGNGIAGKDNCAWYLFGGEETKTEFIGR